LKDIKELLALRDNPEAGSGEVREKAVAKLADIDQRIKDLEAMKAELARLVATCDGSAPAAHCPIITAIGDGDRPA
jgi:DNA-binding transcriptional MerR regulator